jgi:hypothetical protein
LLAEARRVLQSVMLAVVVTSPVRASLEDITPETETGWNPGPSLGTAVFENPSPWLSPASLYHEQENAGAPREEEILNTIPPFTMNSNLDAPPAASLNELKSPGIDDAELLLLVGYGGGFLTFSSYEAYPNYDFVTEVFCPKGVASLGPDAGCVSDKTPNLRSSSRDPVKERSQTTDEATHNTGGANAFIPAPTLSVSSGSSQASGNLLFFIYATYQIRYEPYDDVGYPSGRPPLTGDCGACDDPPPIGAMSTPEIPSSLLVLVGLGFLCWCKYVPKKRVS